MIPLKTPPGTAIVYKPIDTTPVENDPRLALPSLTIGRVYTLADIVDPCMGGPSVSLLETAEAHGDRTIHYDGVKYLVRVLYAAEDFELAVLPRCLTELQTEAPAPRDLVPV